MKAEGCAERTGREERRERRDWRREGRRWWEAAEAWDPERWKAMASAWASVWQDGADHGGAGGAAAAPTGVKTCPYCAEEIKAAAVRCKHCSTWLVPPPDTLDRGDDASPWDAVACDAPPRRLTRASGDAMALGVLGGLGHFFGIDPTWLRIAFALGTFFTAIVPGILVYAMLAVIIPAEPPAKGQPLEPL